MCCAVSEFRLFLSLFKKLTHLVGWLVGYWGFTSCQHLITSDQDGNQRMTVRIDGDFRGQDVAQAVGRALSCKGLAEAFAVLGYFPFEPVVHTSGPSKAVVCAVLSMGKSI